MCTDGSWPVTGTVVVGAEVTGPSQAKRVPFRGQLFHQHQARPCDTERAGVEAAGSRRLAGGFGLVPVAPVGAGT